ncbi:hypothetical protein M758_2G179500 [Ceratodon purpureus]|nr:hypothetical protein M758_2G179500 [Ceratodon purpureus]
MCVEVICAVLFWLRSIGISCQLGHNCGEDFRELRVATICLVCRGKSVPCSSFSFPPDILFPCRELRTYAWSTCVWSELVCFQRLSGTR